VPDAPDRGARGTATPGPERGSRPGAPGTGEGPATPVRAPVPPGDGVAAVTSATRGAVVHGTGLQRATAVMAAGTALSRLSGVLRVMALAYALGGYRLADAYNLANTVPNMIYDVVLGGVLSATFIPVFVDRLATRAGREAWRAISAVVTASVALLAVASVVFWFAAPLLIDTVTALNPQHGGTGSLADQRAVATTLLRWFIPQVFFYGLISLATALLNTRRRFAAPMWVPIANNLVSVGVLLWFHQVTGGHPSLGAARLDGAQLVLLGLGTTMGIVVQALLLVPSLWRAGAMHLRWHWDPGHEAVRTVLRLGTWTFGFVVANQVALFVVLTLAGGAGGTSPVSSYTYAYTFMQMPYAVVAVSVMSAVTPDLAEQWALGNVRAFRRRLASGLRTVLAVIVPAAAGMVLLAKPLVGLLLGHGAYTVQDADTTGATLAMFSLGLPGFCTFLYVVRVLQAMQRVRVAFWLYLVENGVNVAMAVALVHPLGIRGLALALSAAYSVAALGGVATLRRWLGPLASSRSWAPLRRGLLATAAMAAVVLVVENLSGATSGVGLFVRVVASVAAGIATYCAVAIGLAARAGRARHGRGRGPGGPRPGAGPRPAPGPGGPGTGRPGGDLPRLVARRPPSR